MTYPIPDPPLPKPGPCTTPSGVFMVELKPCCGLLPGDVCDCDQFVAEAANAFRPRNLARGDLGPITVRFASTEPTDLVSAAVYSLTEFGCPDRASAQRVFHLWPRYDELSFDDKFTVLDHFAGEVSR